VTLYGRIWVTPEDEGPKSGHNRSRIAGVCAPCSAEL
jgi:hypothetical protein